MRRKIIATTLAAALALTGAAATPAQAADDEDIARAIAGIAALFIIGRAISESRERDRDRDPAPQVRRDRASDWTRDRLREHGFHRLLPRECFAVQETRRGPQPYFGKRCLQRHYRWADRLPARCEIRIEGYRHDRVGYSPRCLRHAGYRMDRRY